MHHSPSASRKLGTTTQPADADGLTTADRLDYIATRIELFRAALTVVIRQMPRHELPSVAAVDAGATYIFDIAAAVEHLQQAFNALDKAADQLDDAHAPIGYTLT